MEGSGGGGGEEEVAMEEAAVSSIQASGVVTGKEGEFEGSIWWWSSSAAGAVQLCRPELRGKQEGV